MKQSSSACDTACVGVEGGDDELDVLGWDNDDAEDVGRLRFNCFEGILCSYLRWCRNS